MPVVAQPRRRPHQEPRVRRVRDGARDDLADAGVAEGGDAHRCPLQALLEAVQVGRGEVEVQVPVHAVDAVGLRVRHLVGTHQQAVQLAAHIHRGPRVPDRRGLVAQVHQRRDALGHQVLVDHRHDRHVEAHHGAELRGVVPGGVHDVLADDPIVVADDLPAPVGQLVHVDDTGVAADLGAELAGPASHGVGATGRIGPTVVGGVGRRDHVLQIQQRVQLGDLRRTDDVALHTGLAQQSTGVAVPVRLLGPPLAAQSNGAGLVPAGRQAGLGLDAAVQRNPHLVHLGQVVVAGEVGDHPGGVPGGAGVQLAFLHEDGVGPSLVRQEVQQRRAHGAAADDHDTGLGGHRLTSGVGGRSSAAAP